MPRFLGCHRKGDFFGVFFTAETRAGGSWRCVRTARWLARNRAQSNCRLETGRMHRLDSGQEQQQRRLLLKPCSIESMVIDLQRMRFIHSECCSVTVLPRAGNSTCTTNGKRVTRLPTRGNTHRVCDHCISGCNSSTIRCWMQKMLQKTLMIADGRCPASLQVLAEHVPRTRRGAPGLEEDHLPL